MRVWFEREAEIREALSERAASRRAERKRVEVSVMLVIDVLRNASYSLGFKSQRMGVTQAELAKQLGLSAGQISAAFTELAAVGAVLRKEHWAVASPGRLTRIIALRCLSLSALRCLRSKTSGARLRAVKSWRARLRALFVWLIAVRFSRRDLVSPEGEGRAVRAGGRPSSFLLAYWPLVAWPVPSPSSAS